MFFALYALILVAPAYLLVLSIKAVARARAESDVADEVPDGRRRPTVQGAQQWNTWLLG
jgi:hypothetical protein